MQLQTAKKAEDAWREKGEKSDRRARALQGEAEERLRRLRVLEDAVKRIPDLEEQVGRV